MNHTKIINRKDGSSAKVEVKLYIDCNREEIEYTTKVFCKEKGKRKWNEIVSTSSFEYTKIDFNKRKEYIEEKNIAYLGKDLIQEAKLELWKMLKPEGN